MGFLAAFLLGTIVGLALIVIFVILENRRTLARRRLSVSTAAFSELNVDDVRKLFPKDSLPRWILFTEYEKVSWLNHQLRRVWPSVDKATSELTREIMEPILAQYKPPIISSIKFQKFTLGTVAPQFVGIRKVETEDQEIVLDMEVQWDGNPSIILAVKTMLGVTLPVQVKDVGVTGLFRVVFKPLVDTLPCFGAIMYSLREQKKLDFKLKILKGDVKAFPMVAGAVDGMIRSAVTDSFLWPMRQVVPILPGDYSDLELRACGTLEVRLVQAKDLLNMDMFGKSDPFAQLYIRPIPDRMKKSKTVDNNLNPIWNEKFQFEVEDLATQKLTIDVFDEDNVQASERIGSTQIPLAELRPGVLTELWLPLLKDVKNSREEKYRGQVQVELVYQPFDAVSCTKLSFSKRSSFVRKPPFPSRSSLKNATFHYSVGPGSPAGGILSVCVIRGENLAAKDFNGQSDPYVSLQMKRSNQRKKTKVIYKTLNPEWNQTFEFDVADAFHDMLLLEVWDHNLLRKDFIGGHALTLSKLLHEGAYKEKVHLAPTASGTLLLDLKWTSKQQ